MNLHRPNANEATQTANRSRNVAPVSGICTRCIDGCRGNCEVFKSSFRGREVLYPGPYGTITAGADKEYPVDYSHLNIQGYAQGAKGLPKGMEADPDHAIFPIVDTETEYGVTHKIRMRVPLFTGALGSTDIARNNWDHFAVGAAVSGITIICGENVCGVDPALELKNGKVVRAPDLEHRVEIYRRYREGNYGDLHVQMNVEDTNFGVAEYAIEKLGVESIELKWGQGAKCIGGEIKVKSLERALELKQRGYIVTPDPTVPAVQRAFKEGGIREFERHSRLGFVSEEGFFKEVERLRRLGCKRVSLKTGAYGMVELAQAIKYSSQAKIDLLTIDGAPGGTGMSPWRMMVEWGVPTFYLQSMTQQFCDKLAARGEFIPDIAIAGGFSSRRSYLQGPGDGCPLHQGGLHGQGAHDPWDGGQEYRDLAQEQGSPEDGLRVRHERGGDLRVLRDPQRAVRQRGRELSVGRRGHLHVRGQDQDRPPAAHGREQELLPCHDIEKRPYGLDRRGGTDIRDTLRDGCLPQGGRKDTRRQGRPGREGCEAEEEIKGGKERIGRSGSVERAGAGGAPVRRRSCARLCLCAGAGTTP